MSYILQGFLGGAAQTASSELATALSRVPVEKRDWSPEGKARTALDLFAECAILNGYTSQSIEKRVWPLPDFSVFFTDKAALVAQGEEAIHALLRENTARVIASIQVVPDEDLSNELEMPWGKQTLAEVIAHPYWNMSYHLGQINYIASMLGTLD